LLIQKLDNSAQFREHVCYETAVESFGLAVGSNSLPEVADAVAGKHLRWLIGQPYRYERLLAGLKQKTPERSAMYLPAVCAEEARNESFR
jgi:hypothetical protein